MTDWDDSQDWDEENDFHEPAELVNVWTFSQLQDADMARVMLDLNGIECIVEGGISSDPIMGNASGGARIMVLKSGAAEAYRLLKAASQQQADEEAARAKICPECEAENGAEIKRPILFALLVVLSLGIFSLLIPWPKYQCPTCGHKWK